MLYSISQLFGSFPFQISPFHSWFSCKGVLQMYHIFLFLYFAKHKMGYDSVYNNENHEIIF